MTRSVYLILLHACGWTTPPMVPDLRPGGLWPSGPADSGEDTGRTESADTDSDGTGDTDPAPTDSAPAEHTGIPVDTDVWPTEIPAPGYDIGVGANYGCSMHPVSGLNCWGGGTVLLVPGWTDRIYPDYVWQHPRGSIAAAIGIGQAPYALLDGGFVISWPQRYGITLTPDGIPAPATGGVTHMGINSGTYWGSVLLDGSAYVRYPTEMVIQGYYKEIYGLPGDNGGSSFLLVGANTGQIFVAGDENYRFTHSFPVNESWKTISPSHNGGCGIRTSGEIFCSASLTSPQLQSDAPTGTGWRVIDMTSCSACALHEDGHAACWGHPDCMDNMTPPPERFVDIDYASGTACGIRLDGYVFCWGDNDWGERDATPPP
jgi:hypothetical protein